MPPESVWEDLEIRGLKHLLILVKLKLGNEQKGYNFDKHCILRLAMNSVSQVVEVYFLNDADQYLQVELSPHGQFNVLLFRGHRDEIIEALPLKVVIENNCKAEDCPEGWTGNFVIPKCYLPIKVSKFNAHAQHGGKWGRGVHSTRRS